MEELLTECLKTKTKVITLAHHKGERTNQISNYTQLTQSAEKACASESRLVLVLLPIG